MTKNFVIASDHAGFSLKQELQDRLAGDYEFTDLGTDSPDSVDYPDFANKLAEHLKENKHKKGILICGSGVGISIAANRHKHIRAALCHNTEISKLSRLHNDANVIVIGARFCDKETAISLIKVFAETEFAGERHIKRVNKLS